MTRYLLRIEYNGGPFRGWQRQEDAPTVQGALEVAARQLTDDPVIVYGAGRTDAGVHATGQAAHIDLLDTFPDQKVADALNYHLRPDPIAVLSAHPVPDAFHARFDATERQYRYVILNRRADLTVDRGLAWRIASPLDAGAMHKAAQHLVGKHDFTTFRDVQCQAKTPVKHLDAIAVTRNGARIEFTCSALSFLHRQVRSIVGSLTEIGRGRQEEAWLSDILAARDRTACGPVAPACGLYLEYVHYPTLTIKEHMYEPEIGA